ncbi:hypothetical protein [Spirillospora sp. CA-294931]|uniref:hypothetical protein n=1 Tax=Spirillospora sp. CA-294931 TaxID=3240042 RepID=UPI003D89E041
MTLVDRVFLVLGVLFLGVLTGCELFFLRRARRAERDAEVRNAEVRKAVEHYAEERDAEERP